MALWAQIVLGWLAFNVFWCVVAFVHDFVFHTAESRDLAEWDDELEDWLQ